MPNIRRQTIAMIFLAALTAGSVRRVAVAQLPCLASDVCLLESNADAIRARVRLINVAAERIDLASYAVDTGTVSLGLLELMCEAAGRGVRARLLVDAMQTDLPPALASLLCSRGVEVRFYHPIRVTQPLEINQRMHVKLLVVDRQAMVIGSRNLQDSHFGLEEVNFVDFDVAVGGPICERASAYFDRLWSSDEVEPSEPYRGEKRSLLPGGRGEKDDQQQLTPLQWQARMAQARENVLAIAAECGASERGGCVAQVSSYLVSDATADKSTDLIQDQIVAMIDSARHCVALETPYPVFSHAMFAALRRAEERGVDVMLLTNSLRSTDRVAVYAAYHNDKFRLLRIGVKLYEFDSSDHLHAKTLIVDDRIALVGSHNFDSRSDRFNLELGVALVDPQTVSLVRESFQRRLARGRQIDSPLEVIDAPGEDSRRLQLSIRRLTVNLYRIFL